jgi:predicted nucleic acid-binding Zn ribbon protein
VTRDEPVSREPVPPDPVLLRDALTALSRRLGVPDANVVDELAAAWNDVAGDALAPHARVRGLRAGECAITVDGPVWATRARYLADTFRARANKRLGRPLVRTVKVVVDGPAETV